ncbi:ribosomal protein S5 domain 2-like protein [Epithele typhae]|uniref:ribosomal protein S5 domain 2-like protein n=1 Tax=Epithele typhae TaxID=378194 RepID=UPI00200891FD|nr:ribosomal protein S5 domain 2-like protein [Epithele typhae]KAH9942139.1 ribosomal protein S5 domain 2-like protein [Epithele typhae]
MANLDAFEIRDRGSAFVANVYPASTPDAARRAQIHLKHVAHTTRPASHEIAAWRCMVLQRGKTGLGGPDDFELVAGSDDDGEKYAGGRVLKVMQAEGVIDAVVVVSRWFGGEMLGPARFDHVETCAREVCRTFRLKDDMATAVSTLKSLDDVLASLRKQLAPLQTRPEKADGTSTLAPKKAADPYSALETSLDIAKAKRLITARENSIRSVKLALKKARASALDSDAAAQSTQPQTEA